jgi:hypothetical protein
MQYANQKTAQRFDDQYIKHVGYSEQLSNDSSVPSGMELYYSDANIRNISNKITQLLMGVDKQNRPIIVPDNTIGSVMSSVYSTFKPPIGDIFSIYTIPSNNINNYVQNMIDKVINIIVTDVKINLGMDEANAKLSIWTTVLGDFNEHGLRSHSKIKLRERKPTSCLFNMNY